MEDAISLGVGEPDFDTPWRVREEGIYSLERGRTFYTSNAGLKELKLEISRYLARTIQVDYDYSREVLVTVGGSEAIDLAFRAMLDPGDEVLIPQPSYVSYLPCAVLADGVPVTIPLQHENSFKLTREELVRGLVCSSSGNHAQGVAYAAHRLGTRAVIVMPTTANPVKLAGVKKWGGEDRNILAGVYL